MQKFMESPQSGTEKASFAARPSRAMRSTGCRCLLHRAAPAPLRAARRQWGRDATHGGGWGNQRSSGNTGEPTLPVKAVPTQSEMSVSLNGNDPERALKRSG